MYTVRKSSKNHYQVAKWGDRREPEAVYHIKYDKCDCPASFRSKTCKHKKLVECYESLEPGAWSFDFVGSQVQPFHEPWFDFE